MASKPWTASLPRVHLKTTPPKLDIIQSISRGKGANGAANADSIWIETYSG